MITTWLSILLVWANSHSGLREVKATACEIIPIKVAVGMTTQLIFEEEPKLTLFAEEKRYQIASNPQAPRSIAIIPRFSPEDIERAAIRSSQRSLSDKEVSKLLNEAFKTNLFVFFERQDQFLLSLQIVPKSQSDLIVKVHRKFSEDCVL